MRPCVTDGRKRLARLQYRQFAAANAWMEGLRSLMGCSDRADQRRLSVVVKKAVQGPAHSGEGDLFPRDVDLPNRRTSRLSLPGLKRSCRKGPDKHMHPPYADAQGAEQRAHVHLSAGFFSSFCSAPAAMVSPISMKPAGKVHFAQAWLTMARLHSNTLSPKKGNGADHHQRIEQ